MNIMRYRPQLCVGIVFGILLLALGLPLGYIASKAIWAEDALATMEPRYARLLGMKGAADAVKQSRLAAEAELARYAYPPTVGADRVGTDLQQRLRAIAESAGVAVSGSQIVPGETDKAIEVIPVSLTLEAEAGQLNAMLLALSDQAPAIFTESLALQPVRVRDGVGRRVTVKARFSVLRQLP